VKQETEIGLSLKWVFCWVYPQKPSPGVSTLFCIVLWGACNNFCSLMLQRKILKIFIAVNICTFLFFRIRLLQVRCRR